MLKRRRTVLKTKKRPGGRWNTLARVVVPLAGTLVVLAIVVTAIVPNPTRSVVKVRFAGGTELEVFTQGSFISYDSLMVQLFSKDEGRRLAVSWLADSMDMYSVHDRRIVQAISERICDDIPTRPFSQRMSKSAECAAKPVVIGFNDLKDKNMVPFHHVHRLERAGVQKEIAHMPKPGEVNVCRNGGYLGKRIQVTDVLSERSIELEAKNYYTCTGSRGDFPALQLNPIDARRLFGRPTLPTEDVIVVEL